MKSLAIISSLSIISLGTAAISGITYQYQEVPQNSIASHYNEPKSIIRDDYKGNYVYGFETSDGIVQRQAGEADGSKRGYYSYVGTDGRTYTVCYVADENGYRIVGDPMLGATKEIQCPYNTDKRRPVPFKKNGYNYNKPQAIPIRRNGYGYDKPAVPLPLVYQVPEIDPFLPPHY